MSDPLIDPADLGTYLNDSSINYDRAALMIQLAQSSCEAIVSPLPDLAAPIVMRVAARGYTDTLTSHQARLAASGSPYAGTRGGAPRLWDEDESDLRRLVGGNVGVFSVDILPVGYVAPSTSMPLSDGFDTQF